ncbi:hypothetical protein WJ0W_002189 [Paenibacillus melissococcoides]|uniref:Uncharacterized protein n=1 Tax=Paenibacillus melissococcoides TaxID=2912268 RepID=A0ABM9G050_9BACL|nr:MULTISPECIES: hypothetical protein [Paenibacillus]MEB9894034.1 hypothetical protein [Bacillus cereus]CAH8244959.1 hypothetical protein WJ0W_002189 [Paenibacillus melissococcoides]CAH8709486.1 hypothetical protein WDD9_002271 [Paenibacillus melissococcoides]CAH8710213.1 hypothetical protein HTL2_002558 [Paenibacillus melissococcoides]GIO82187.1 hypothetical protein J6TS7_57970 [Paenibacillus dendritiformis]
MSKTSKLLTVSLLCFSLIIATFGNQSASAHSSEELVPPLLNALQQSEDEVNNHLIKMGFNDNEVEKLPLEMKQDIVSKGGVKKEVIKTDSKVIHKDQNGNELTVTPFYSDSMFELTGYAVKTASYTTENEYDIYVNYTWKKQPLAVFTDTVAISWQSQGTPIAGTAYSRHTLACYHGGAHTTHLTNEMNNSSNLSGTGWDVDLIYLSDDDWQYGYGKQTIRVGKSYEGTTGAFQVGYAHRNLPGTVSISFGPASIDFGGFSEEVFDRYNFTY